MDLNRRNVKPERSVLKEQFPAHLIGITEILNCMLDDLDKAIKEVMQGRFHKLCVQYLLYKSLLQCRPVRIYDPKNVLLDNFSELGWVGGNQVLLQVMNWKNNFLNFRRFALTLCLGNIVKPDP